MGCFVLLLAVTFSIVAGDTSLLTLSPAESSLINTRNSSTTDTSSSATISSISNTSTTETATKAPTKTINFTNDSSDGTSSETSATVIPPNYKPQIKHESSTSVDSLNDINTTLSSGSSTANTTLPLAFGALACIGVIVMAISYKKKRETKESETDNNHPNSSNCIYTSDYRNRRLSAVKEDSLLGQSAGTNVSSSSFSPFGSKHCKARVSSPVDFRGSNVVLTFGEASTDHRTLPIQL